MLIGVDAHEIDGVRRAAVDAAERCVKRAVRRQLGQVGQPQGHPYRTERADESAGNSAEPRLVAQIAIHVHALDRPSQAAGAAREHRAGTDLAPASRVGQPPVVAEGRGAVRLRPRQEGFLLPAAGLGECRARVRRLDQKPLEKRAQAIELRRGFRRPLKERLWSAGLERIAELAAPSRVQAAKQVAVDQTHRHAVVKGRVPVWPGTREREADPVHELHVAVEQMSQGRALIDGETILMFGQLARLQRIEATVMEKSERPIVDQDVIGATLEPSRVQIPVGDVVRRVAQNGGVREETRYEIDPLLIDEQTVRDVDTAMIAQAFVPPVEHALHF